MWQCANGGSAPCRLRYCLACFFRHRAVLPAAPTTAWPAFSATGQYHLPPPLLPGLLLPPQGSTTCRPRYCLACFFRHRAVPLVVPTTAWLAFSATVQYYLPPPLLPGLLFPPPGSTTHAFSYCLACFFRHRAVPPAAPATAWLAFSATGQCSLPPPLLPGLLFPPSGSTTHAFRYCLACFFRLRAVPPVISTTTDLLFPIQGSTHSSKSLSTNSSMQFLTLRITLSSFESAKHSEDFQVFPLISPTNPR